MLPTWKPWKSFQKKFIVITIYGSEHLVKYRIEKVLMLTARGLHHRWGSDRLTSHGPINKIFMRPEKHRLKSVLQVGRWGRWTRKLPSFPPGTDIEMILSSVCGYYVGSCESYYLEMLLRQLEKKESIWTWP